MSRANRRHSPPSPPLRRSAPPITGESPEVTQLADPHHREKQILEIIQARAARIPFLNADIFHDPAWDMLLALFAAKLGHRSITAGSLGLIARIPPSTAFRYVKTLEQAGLVLAGPDEYDEQASVQLSRKGVGAMESYFDYLNSGKFPEVISVSKH